MRLVRLIVPLFVVAACSSSNSASSGFDVSLVIEGQGSVQSSPSGFDCAGPADCGTKSFEGALTLTASPAPGYAVQRWLVDDVPSTSQTDALVLDGARPALTRVRLELVQAGPGIPGADAGPTDAGPASDAAPDGGALDAGPTVACGTVDCAIGQRCCAHRDYSSSMTTAPRCGAGCNPSSEIEVRCAHMGCGAGETCCGDVATNSMQCKATAACQEPSCLTNADCKVQGQSCVTIAQDPVVKICSQGA